MYELWPRVLKRDTLFMVQCWKGENKEVSPPVAVEHDTMVADFSPILDILHIESCWKNQELGGAEGAWCFYMQLSQQSSHTSALVADEEENDSGIAAAHIDQSEL